MAKKNIQPLPIQSEPLIGHQLIDALIRAVALPKPFVKEQFYKLLIESKNKPETLTLEDLKAIVGKWAGEVLLEAKIGLNSDGFNEVTDRAHFEKPNVFCFTKKQKPKSR